MPLLTQQGQQIVAELAQRYGFSVDAVMNLLQAVVAGNGTMAQFNHPELGGGGQWMQGGMIMIGDMFNNALKSKVDGVCSEISNLLIQQPLFTVPAQSQSQSQGMSGDVSLFVAPFTSGSEWPEELGSPSSTGTQNNIRYAIFPATRRLAISVNGQITVYDTLQHQISGVSQQQGYGASLTFTSQYGLVRVAELPVVSGSAGNSVETPVESAASSATSSGSFSNEGGDSGDVFVMIERLANLKQKGILSEDEFTRKKAELLNRI
jgi:hypothetical protein